MIVWGAPGAGKTSIALSLRGWQDEPPAFNRIDWYDGPTLAALLGLEEKAAA